MASGNLSTPRVPNFKGIGSFKGKWYHSGLWPHEGVDFTGLRVGVIGTGSSGVQMIPLIARQAKHLHVFQRTANFSLPARNAPMEEERESRHKAEYPARRRAAYDTPFAIGGYPRPTQSALDVTEEERNAAYESKWKEGGSISYLYTYTDLLVNKEANDTASEFARNKIRGIVKDKRTAELLAPKDHPIGTKRLCLDTNYYETYNRDNVVLVDVRSAPIQEITEKGVRTAEKEYELDAIVFATGFDAMTGALREIDIRTSDGAVLADHWEGGPLTYLGLMVSGFPNMFVVTGPGSPGVKTQMIASIEQHVDWIADAIDHLGKHQLDRIEPSPQAESEWVGHVNAVADSTLYPLANSWYVGANIPGKPRVFMPYVGGFDRYKRHCDEIVAQGLRGLHLEPPQSRSGVSATYVHHRIDAAPRRWQAVADRLSGDGARRIAEAGGQLYGAWRSQIGRPRDEVQAISVWPQGITAAAAERVLLADKADIRAVASEAMVPTLRPTDTVPPTRQGNYAFRWFAVPEPHWPEFLDLCAAAWPGFEGAYDSQVVGLWQTTGDRTGTAPDEVTGAGLHGGVRSLLLTRRPIWRCGSARSCPKARPRRRCATSSVAATISATGRWSRPRRFSPPSTARIPPAGLEGRRPLSPRRHANAALPGRPGTRGPAVARSAAAGGRAIDGDRRSRPEMVALIDRSRLADDPIARQFVPSGQEAEISAAELADPIGDEARSPVKGIVHRYPDRVLLKPLHVCPVYCRFCFRREKVGPGGEALSAEELAAALAYIRGAA